jgi:hypothetical protein
MSMGRNPRANAGEPGRSPFSGCAVDQLRVRDDGTGVLSAGTPGLPGVLAEPDLRFRDSCRIPPHVGPVQELVGGTAPVRAEPFPPVADHHVAFEHEGAVRLGTGAHHGMVHVVHDQVVPHPVVASVMLVETRVGAAVHDVVLHHDPGAAFVGVERPSAVAIAADVVEQVVPHDCPRLRAQGVDAAHVAEQPLADVVGVVELDDVVVARRRGVAPVPADRDRGVEEVVETVVRDVVRGAVEDEDPAGGREDPAQGVQVVVLDPVGVAGLRRDRPGFRGVLGRKRGRANTDAAGAKFLEPVGADAPVPAADADPEAVATEVGEGGLLDRDPMGVHRRERSFDLHRSLRGDAPRAGHLVVRLGEHEVAEHDVVDRVGRCAFDADERGQAGGGDVGAVRVEVGGAPEPEAPLGGIPSPFTGLVQGVGGVLDPVAGVGFVHPVRELRSGEADHAGGFVDGQDRDVEIGPLHQSDQFRAGRFPGSPGVAGMERQLDRVRAAQAAIGAQEARVRGPGTAPADAVHEELSGSTVPQRRRFGLEAPESGRTGLPHPAQKPDAAGETAASTGTPFDDGRRNGRARMLGTDPKRFRQRRRARSEDQAVRLFLKDRGAGNPS